MKCEWCEKDKDGMYVTMPTRFGVFTSELCIDCGLVIHEDREMLMRIVRKRAQERKIPLPCSSQELTLLIVSSKIPPQAVREE